MADTNEGMGTAELSVTPTDALLDEALSIRVEGLEAREEATLIGTWQADSRYRGEATFVAEDGVLDPSDQAPVRGDYEGVRPMGLVQFAREVGTDDSGTADSEDATDSARKIEDGHRLHLSVVVDGNTHDEVTVIRRKRAAGVEQIPVEDHDDELVGDLLLPPGEGPHPGVVRLGGSGGGIPSGTQAKLLASHGYAVLALAYFQPSELGGDTGREDRPMDRLPETLHRVELSYFDRAVSWLADHDQVGDIGILGGSRGSEPAVLTAVRNDVVSSVVVSAPLAYAFCSFSSDAFGEPAWTNDGEAYPYLTNKLKFGTVGWLLQTGWLALTGGYISYASSFRRAVDAATAEERKAAALPVEDADAPLLFISGGDDALAPSEYMGWQLLSRLEEHDYDHEYSHHSYPDAGHVIGAPYTPTRGRESGDPMVGKMRLALGGTPDAYADADIDAWERTLDFLDRTLDGEQSDGVDEVQTTQT